MKFDKVEDLAFILWRYQCKDEAVARSVWSFANATEKQKWTNLAVEAALWFERTTKKEPEYKDPEFIPGAWYSDRPGGSSSYLYAPASGIDTLAWLTTEASRWAWHSRSQLPKELYLVYNPHEEKQ